MARSVAKRPSRKSKIHLAGTELSCPCHVCAFFSGADEAYTSLLPFLREGCAAGDHNVYLVDDQGRDADLARLKRDGIDVEAAREDGRLEIETWQASYLQDGRFDQNIMLNCVQEMLGTGSRRGFDRSRIWGNMEWALSDAPGVHDLAEYESRLNYIVPLYEDVVVCAYDTSRFPAATLDDVLRAHPYVLADGGLMKNPNYVTPDRRLPA
jgi:DcmR-like sensory protein